MLPIAEELWRAFSWLPHTLGPRRKVKRLAVLKCQNLEEDPERLKLRHLRKGSPPAAARVKEGMTLPPQLLENYKVRWAAAMKGLLLQGWKRVAGQDHRQTGSHREAKREQTGSSKSLSLLQPCGLPQHPLLAEPNREPLAKQKCRAEYQRLGLELKGKF